MVKAERSAWRTKIETDNSAAYGAFKHEIATQAPGDGLRLARANEDAKRPPATPAASAERYEFGPDRRDLARKPDASPRLSGPRHRQR
jgi:hypothetical protein